MKKRLSFDIHDEDVTLIIYTLLFALHEGGNDKWHEVYPDSIGDRYDIDVRWQQRLKQGLGNCYHNDKTMAEMLKNPPTAKEAIEHFHNWLKKKGVKRLSNPILVKIWW